MDALEKLDNFTEFQKISTLAEENHTQILDTYVKDRTITILKRTLEIKFLGNQIKETNRLRLGIRISSTVGRVI